MCGEDLMRAMRCDDRTWHIPVVVMSSDSTAKRIQEMLDLGAAGYLIKPFYPEMLIQQIEMATGVARV
jgi:CheY-like chemotaxis protein